MEIKIKLLDSDTKKPEKAHQFEDAGFDVYALEPVTINPGQRYRFPLGFLLEIPHGYVGIIQGKSGLANNSGIDTIGNIIDAGYRGECHATLINHGDKELYIAKGQKIAQLLFIKLADVEELTVAENLSESSRGTGGFGSTGN